MGFLIFILFLALVTWGIKKLVERPQLARMTPQERSAYKAIRTATFVHGGVNPAIICPHCQVRGQVHTQAVKTKQGISGAKATGAVLTGGLSVLATGLSRKEAHTEAYCRNCRVTWLV